jgi:hypothetical protein
MLYLKPSVPVASGLDSAPGVVRQAVQGKPLDRVQILSRPDNDHSAFRGGDVLGCIEAEAAEVAEGADSLAPVLRLDRVSAVFDHQESMPVRQLDQRIHVTGSPGEVNRHDRARPVRDSRLHLSGIEVHGRRIDVRKHRVSAGVDDRIDRAAEGERRGDDLVSGFQTGRQQAQVQRRRAGSHRRTVAGALEFREIPLESSDSGPRSNPPGTQARDDFLDFLVQDLRLSEHEERIA